jgi:hypothetical protein
VAPHLCRSPSSSGKFKVKNMELTDSAERENKRGKQEGTEV